MVQDMRYFGALLGYAEFLLMLQSVGAVSQRNDDGTVPLTNKRASLEASPSQISPRNGRQEKLLTAMKRKSD